MEKKCENCGFSDDFGEKDSRGVFCTARPPVVRRERKRIWSTPYSVTSFPFPKRTWWCGEWKPKEPTETQEVGDMYEQHLLDQGD